MKHILLTLGMVIAVAAVASIDALSWKVTSLDLGEVEVNESVDLSFEFTNTTSAPITILNAKGSCGCTQVEYPKEAITPGTSAKITGKFKSTKAGAFNKTIKITTSVSEEPTILSFKGTVL